MIGPNRTGARRLHWCAALLLACLPALACAQQWKPSRHVELVSASGAGSNSDGVIRIVERMLQDKKLVDVSTAVLNKPGAGGSIGWTYLSQQPGDGHHLTLVIGNLMSNYINGISTLQPNDLTCVAQLFSEASAVAVRADSPINDAKDLLARLKADPTALSIYPGTALGGSGHIALALAAKGAGADPKKLKVVMPSGMSQGYAALYGGHIDVIANPHSTFVARMREGKVRVLAVSATQRLPGDFAQVPTWKELGLDVNVDAFRAVAGPKSLDAPQVAFWEGALRKMVESPEWKQLVESRSWIDRYATADECRAGFKEQYDQMRTGLQALGLAKN